MMHDFAMTENYVIFMELPVLFSMFKAVPMDPSTPVIGGYWTPQT